jgi:tetraacyldisaccharide 4'-kinase
MMLRNYLYDWQLRTVTTFMPFTISVGNLSVGGTGKTPHVAYLVRLLASTYPLATLSRGYGRRTKGFRMASPTDTADTIGDEPLQLYEKFHKNITVVVGEQRTKAVPLLLAYHPGIRVLLLDDAYQHRAIGRHLNLLLTDFNHLFTKDLVLPAGRLRELPSGSKRADAVIVTKCNANISQENKSLIKQQIAQYLHPDTPIFLTGIRYAVPLAFDDTPLALNSETKVLLVSGLANADPLEQYLKQAFSLHEHYRYGDHHAYTIADVEQIIHAYQSIATPDKVILCTEKDKVKLKPLMQSYAALRVGYLPIEVYFLEDGDVFDNWVLAQVRAYYEPKNP